MLVGTDLPGAASREADALRGRGRGRGHRGGLLIAADQAKAEDQIAKLTEREVEVQKDSTRLRKEELKVLGDEKGDSFTPGKVSQDVTGI